jgi:hypothetical protein
MSDQDMQFADPDWKPTNSQAGNNGAQGKQQPEPAPASAQFQPRPINDAWREQPAAVEAPAESYQRGYDGLPPNISYPGSMPGIQSPYQYQPQQTRYGRRRRGPWLWIILLILLFSLFGGGLGSLGSIGQKNVVNDHFYNVTGTPTIVLHETVAGDIHVQQGGSASSLDIQTNRQSGWFDDPNNIQVNIQQSGNTFTVGTNSGGGGFLSNRNVDFTITVPQNANLDLQTDSGDISVNNVNGLATLSTNSGDISATADNFSANSSLQTTSGDVRASGDVLGDGTAITTTSGDIHLDNDTLQGSEKFNATSGDIDFNGTVDPKGIYQFEDVSGDITINLQQGQSYSVNAQTASGSINTDDSSPVQAQDNPTGPGQSATGTVGTAPFAQFNLSTQSGDITIH